MRFDASKLYSRGLLERSRRLLCNAGRRNANYVCFNHDVRKIVRNAGWLLGMCAADLRLLTPDQCIHMSWSIVKRISERELSVVKNTQPLVEMVKSVGELVGKYESKGLTGFRTLDGVYYCRDLADEIDYELYRVPPRSISGTLKFPNMRLQYLAQAVHVACDSIICAMDSRDNPEQFKRYAENSIRNLLTVSANSEVGPELFEPEIGQLKELVLDSINVK